MLFLCTLERLHSAATALLCHRHSATIFNVAKLYRYPHAVFVLGLLWLIACFLQHESAQRWGGNGTVDYSNR
jgi:hypothetical protein